MLTLSMFGSSELFKVKKKTKTYVCCSGCCDGCSCCDGCCCDRCSGCDDGCCGGGCEEYQDSRTGLGGINLYCYLKECVLQNVEDQMGVND